MWRKKTGARMNPEELLEHEDFVRNLARSLVSDENSSSDITQQTWLAALEHPPSSEKIPRSWLRKVVRNFAINLLRGDARRAARERAAAIPEGIPSTEDLAALEETRQAVVKAVLNLDEPHRSAVVLRYYHDLPATEVARRLNVPVETARSRLKRGLAKLREQLDAEHGGDRMSWCISLAMLAGLKLSPHAKAAGMTTTSGASFLGAGAILGTKVKIVIASALLLGAAITLWQVWPESPDQPSEPPDIAAAEPGLPVSDSGAPVEATLAESSTAEEPAREAIAPSPTEVTWRGSVIDFGGVPLEGALLKIGTQPRSSPAAYPEGGFSCTSGDQGGFEIDGIPPGTYNMVIKFPHHKWWLECGKTTFDKPGIVERDIHIADGGGGCVTGIMIDEATGKPVNRDGANVAVAAGKHRLTGGVDPQSGTFRVRNVPAGTWPVAQLGPGVYIKVPAGMVTVEEGAVTDSLRLTLPPLGDLHVVVSGFTEEEIEKLEIKLGLASGFSFPYPGSRLKREPVIAMPEGEAGATVTMKGAGSITRSFEIVSGKVTELVVLRSDLVQEKQGPVSVTGKLERADGSPAREAWLGISKRAGIKFGYAEHEAFTDQQGRFAIDNIEPGPWSAWCVFRGRETAKTILAADRLADLPTPIPMLFLHNIVIPENPASGFALDMVLPGGSLKGRLFDAQTELPLDANVPWWRVELAETRLMKHAGAVWSRRDNRFELQGVAAGEYHMIVMASGFQKHYSDTFTLQEGQVLDLGDIHLNPTGVLEIEVVDAAGSPISFDAEYAGETASNTDYDRFHHSPGKRVLSCLPPGEVSLVIRASGFEAKTIVVNLEPRQRAKTRVVLEPDDK